MICPIITSIYDPGQQDNTQVMQIIHGFKLSNYIFEVEWVKHP